MYFVCRTLGPVGKVEPGMHFKVEAKSFNDAACQHLHENGGEAPFYSHLVVSVRRFGIEHMQDVPRLYRVSMEISAKPYKAPKPKAVKAKAK